jgi:hypothetical protein
MLDHQQYQLNPVPRRRRLKSPLRCRGVSLSDRFVLDYLMRTVDHYVNDENNENEMQMDVVVEKEERDNVVIHGYVRTQSYSRWMSRKTMNCWFWGFIACGIQRPTRTRATRCGNTFYQHASYSQFSPLQLLIGPNAA